jgi:Rrf2 family protein
MPASVFSTTFRYSLISLLELADSEEFLQANRIARKFQLSQHYLSVVLRDLRRLGLVESQKGNRGGYRLLRSADGINLLDLHRSLAGSGQDPASHGSLTDAWLDAIEQRVNAELASSSLADLRQWIAAQEP